MIDATSATPYVNLSPEPPQPRAPDGDLDAARKAATEFEAFVVGEFVETMFKGVKEDPLFGGGSGGQMFQSLLHREYAEQIAESGGLGIADAVTKELLRAQENAQ